MRHLHAPLRTLSTVATLAFLLLASGPIACVSVNLGPKSAERSSGVQMRKPDEPYRPLKDSPADGAWQSAANGNSISYFSTCNDPADPTLEAVARELFSGFTEMKVITDRSVTYNGREALDSEVEGKVDGVLTRVRSMIFKKNGCTYTLSHIGVPKAFDEDRGRFEEFLRSFQAP